MRINYSLLFLLFYSSLNILNGQITDNAPNNLKFKHFSTKEGLSQSSVIDILQDKKGYLWFGTRDGLNRYDGAKFTTYRHNSEDISSLTHSWITTIYEDNHGNLWIGTKDGLNKYNVEHENFEQYNHITTAPSISDNEIWDITQIDNDHIWVATNNGIDKIHIKENVFTHFKYEKNNLNSLRDNRIRSFLKTIDGKLWVCTVEGVTFYDSIKNSFEHFNYPPNTLKEALINNAPTLFTDSQNQIWMGYGQGLAKFNELKNKFEVYYLNNSPAVESAVRTICEDIHENLWIGTYTGLFILNEKQGELNQIIHNENNPKSLSQNSIYKIIQDSRGDIWIGTWAGGINFFDRSYDNFKQLSAGATNNMLNYKVISSIIEDSNDQLWIGTEGGGINIYDKKSGVFEYHTQDPNNVQSLSSNNVKSMIKDSRGNFWIGTHDGGLNFLDPKIKPFRFKRFNAVDNNQHRKDEYRILAIKEDSNKNLWIGTLRGGLLFYDIEKNTFTQIEEKVKSVTCIIGLNNSDDLLIGGSDGVERINVQTQKIDKVVLNDKNTQLNSSKTVNCIYTGIDGNYWIGTEGLGIYKYNLNERHLEKYGIAQGLPNEVIYGILPDDNNHLWISTNNGISRLNLVTGKINNFDESDGLQSSEFNYGAYLKAKNGELMFGGTNGLNYFNPTDIIENTFIPPVDIYSIKVSNKPFLKITDAVSEIELKYNQNDFSLDFTALSYSQPNKNNYAYFLEGFDPDWNYIGNNKTATYTNLDEGKYTFRVKASNNNGLWNEKGASIKISILPAPWKTWWAYVIYILVGLTLIYYIRKLALTRIKEKNELKKEKLDKEKLEEVNKLKLRLFTNISHDFRTPLTLITGPVEQLLNQKNSNSVIKRNLETIQRNTHILLQLINELLDFRKNESGKLELYASKNNIISFTKNIKLSFEELAIQRNIQYDFTYTKDTIEVWFDKIKLKKILFNLLSNAFKFTLNNNKILLHISTVHNMNNSELIDEYVKIGITNFGKVIPEEHIAFIFDRFYQLDQQDVQSGTGIGLSLTKSLVELHKGLISVSSSTEKGTCFTVLLPLGKKHLNEKECLNETEKNTENETFDRPAFVLKELRSEEIEGESLKDDFDESLDTLLIVEDNTEVRNFIKNIFIKKHNIFEAANGKLAIDIAKEKPIDLIISDVMMPIMNGFDLCKEIKTNIITSHVPIILLTAKTSDIHRKEGYKIGADAYIKKPFNANILEVRVSNILKSRKNLIDKFKKDLILEPKELTFTSTDELFLQKAIDFVEQNLTNPDFTINSFIFEMNMSRSVLYRKLKALTNQSISEFIRTIKLKRAGQLIVQTQRRISEIAYDLGFNDLKHFRKSFQKIFNELPSQYRINNLKKTTENNTN